MKFTHTFYESNKASKFNTDSAFAVLLGFNNNSKDMINSLNNLGVSACVVFSKEAFDKSLGENSYENATVIKIAQSLIEYLNEKFKGKKTKVVISSDDTYTVLLAYAELELNSSFILQKTSKELVKTCSNKIEFYQLCFNNNIDAPLTLIIKDKKQLYDIKDLIVFPGIVKPQYSGAVPKAVIPKVMKINNFDELLTLSEKVWKYNVPVFFQEMIPGDSTAIFFVGGIFSENIDDSQLFIGQKILEMPVLGGSTSYAVLKWNSEVLTAAHKVLKKIKYEGLVDIEFKYDYRDKKYKIIEVNPRIGRWHAISRADNLDIISYYFLQQLRVNFNQCILHVEGKKWMSPYLALCGFIETKGIFIGTFHWLISLSQADIKVDVTYTSFGALFTQIKVVLGHIKKLSIKKIITGA